MSRLLQQVHARTNLAGTNKLEILLFSLGACYFVAHPLHRFNCVYERLRRGAIRFLRAIGFPSER